MEPERVSVDAAASSARGVGLLEGLNFAFCERTRLTRERLIKAQSTAVAPLLRAFATQSRRKRRVYESPIGSNTTLAAFCNTIAPYICRTNPARVSAHQKSQPADHRHDVDIMPFGAKGRRDRF